MEEMIKTIAARLSGMRDVLGIPEEEIARATGLSVNEYKAMETGQRDFTFSFLHRAASRFGLDLTDLLTGESPHRSGYTLIRKGQGLPIERRAGFHYLSLAPFFRGRLAEPFYVVAPRSEERRVGKECRTRWAQYHEKKKR